MCVFMPSEDMGWVYVYWKHHVHISICLSCVKKVFYLWERVLQQNNFQHSSMQGNPTPPITPQAAAGGYPPDIKPFQQDMKPRMMKRGEWQQCDRERWLDNENSGLLDCTSTLHADELCLPAVKLKTFSSLYVVAFFVKLLIMFAISMYIMCARLCLFREL